jgi:hypothetical protein
VGDDPCESAVTILAQDVYARLTGHAGLATLVGDRIYPEHLPQNPTCPAVTYFQVGGPRDHSLAGSSGLAVTRWQVDVWAPTYIEAKAVAEEVRLALDSYRTTTMRVFLDNEVDLPEPTQDTSASLLNVRHVALEFEVWYTESKPQEA